MSGLLSAVAVALSVVLALPVITAAFMVTRVVRARPPAVVFDSEALTIIGCAAAGGAVRVIATEASVYFGEHGTRGAVSGTAPPCDQPGLGIFLEVDIVDASAERDSAPLTVHGTYLFGYPMLRVSSVHTGQSIAAVLVGIRAVTGVVPRADFAWPSRGHAQHLLRFLLCGTGYTAPMTREILRRAEPDASLRPKIHVS